MSSAKQAIVEEQLREMISTGVVEPSHSGWASPVVLPPKKMVVTDFVWILEK